MARIVQWATGSMGRTSIRRILDDPRHQLVGGFVYGARKNGNDLGAIARRDPIGVAATNDRQQILDLDADLVLHMPRITLPYDALVDDVAALLRSGKNIISVAGFHFPQAHGEDYVRRLHDAAIKGGATLAGVGVNPGLIVERLALAATAMSHELERLAVFETVDASAMTSPDFVFGLMGFNSDPAAADIRSGPLADLYGQLFSEVLHFAAAELGTSVREIRPDHRLTLAPKPLTIASGQIEEGRVAATEWRWTALTQAGPEILMSILWTADPSLHGPDKLGHWKIEITGRPAITMTLDITEADPAMPPSRALTDAVVAVAVRAIPDVIAAPPGFFAYRPPAAWSAA
ncbi:hypothetical protein V6R86_08890 [Sphingomonas kaistensis]|uniref:Dihydrodipicolinate reductase n=1 Tax=Sphingomonas kaistensis TaxID=298708 RepID=A0ABZ2G4I9_9SPHN